MLDILAMLCKQGVGVRVPLAPTWKNVLSQDRELPDCCSHCLDNGSVLGLIEQAMQPGQRVPLCWGAVSV